MRSERVVLMPPALDQDLGLEQRIEELTAEKLGAKFPVERFDIAILPRASGSDEQGCVFSIFVLADIVQVSLLAVHAHPLMIQSTDP